jgi:hypothetical protein
MNTPNYILDCLPSYNPISYPFDIIKYNENLAQNDLPIWRNILISSANEIAYKSQLQFMVQSLELNMRQKDNVCILRIGRLCDIDVNGDINKQWEDRTDKVILGAVANFTYMLQYKGYQYKSKVHLSSITANEPAFIEMVIGVALTPNGISLINK